MCALPSSVSVRRNLGRILDFVHRRPIARAGRASGDTCGEGSVYQFLDTEVCCGGLKMVSGRICGTCPYGLLSSSSFLEGGGYTLLRLNAPSASRWFASTSMKQDADTCLRTRANYTKGRGFPSTIQRRISVSAQGVRGCLILGRTSINASSCPVRCLKNDGASPRAWPLIAARFLLKVDISKRLAVAVPHDEAGAVMLLDNSRAA